MEKERVNEEEMKEKVICRRISLRVSRLNLILIVNEKKSKLY